VLSIFLGFALFTLSVTYARFKNNALDELLEKLKGSAILINCVAAIAYTIIWIADFFTRFHVQEEYYSLLIRLTGPYWYGYWIYPITYGIVPHLLWVRKIRNLKAVHVVVALLFLFALYIEKIIIIVTSLHRDYVPASWSMLPGYSLIYDWLISLIIFAIVLTVVHFVRIRTRSAGFERK
jgi:molybdopterin-containing oxidoreductase family membrane subunit